ncbi:MAG: 8-oxoguanine deaminase [Spirochaetaceae bacterium]|nr:8-oxoguanine deaminase [Spirochaetaceae bacterium]MDT8297669.1 8-oxoguanine deaminase [Spirochaetaceae bacterium]
MIHIRNASAVMRSADGEVLRDCDVLIKGTAILEVGKNLTPPPGSDVQVVDAAGMVVVPGLVNTHHHFYQTFTRNLPAAQDAELFDWLIYLYDIWKHMDADSVWWSTALATAELLKTGCTTATDHHYLYPQGIGADIMALQFDAASRTGMRFSPTRGSMSRSKKDGGLPPDSTVQDEDVILDDSERVIKEFHDPDPWAMRKVALAPCSPFSVSEQLMKDSAALARQYGARLHTHLAETRDEDDYCVKIYKRRPLKLMEDCDFIGEDVWFAHGIFFNDEELDLLASTGTHIAHCPSSNMRLGSGICRVREMLDRNINVALAVDGSASNDTSDMLGEVRQALLLQRVTKGAKALSAGEAWRMAGENGAKLLGFEKIGRLEEGWAADLAIFDVRDIPYVGALSDPAAALIFSGYNHQAAYTIVNGRIVVEDGKLVGIEEDELVAKATDAVNALYGRAGV